MATKTKQLGPFLGENNRLPDFRLSGESGAFVRSAINVDLPDASTFKRRQGVERKVSGTDCHSLWASGTDAYFVDHDTLYHLSPALVKTAVSTQVVPGQQVSFADVNGVIYCSTGAELFQLSGASAAVRAGIVPPNASPTLTAAAGGSLPAGIYQATISFVAPSGDESGALRPVSVAVPENGSLTISGIQVSAGYSTAVYLSPPNGDVLFRIAKTTDAALPSITIQPQSNASRARTILLSRMPPGQLVRYADGRLVVASGNILYYSELFAPTLHNPAKSYIPFAENITMVLPCEGGIYVSADKTYWIAGDLASAAITTVLPYKAVFGTDSEVPNSNNVWWMSERGMVVGSPGGQVENVQEKFVAVDAATAGASLYREQDGMRQMLSSLFGTQTNAMAASSYMEFEVIRKETAL
jgi:hypothetical protein